MAYCEADEKILAAFASAKDEHAELAPLLDFYRLVYQTQCEAKAEIGRVWHVAPGVEHRQRLSMGRVLLDFDQLPVTSGRFVKLVRQMTLLILENSPGWELPSQPVEPAALTDIARHWFESGEPVISDGQPIVLINIAVGFALSSYLQLAAELLLPGLNLAEWRRNVCPTCGGKPGFALLSKEDGGRSLFCPRCYSLWPYRRTTCPFCENDEGIVYYTNEEACYRLYVCPKCRRYIKTMDLRQTAREPVVPVERILTLHLDMAAQEEGLLYS